MLHHDIDPRVSAWPAAVRGRTARAMQPAEDYPSLFEAQAARTPQRIALEFQGTSLTYSELNQQANRLAGMLVTRGVGPEIIVGIFLERSLEMVVAMLAVQKAGGVCLPLETSYPAERIGAMLDDTACLLVVTREPLAGRLPQWPGRALCLEREARVLSAIPSDNPPRRIGPHNAVQVMFTSGSTGRPKGVSLTHGGFLNFLRSMIDRPGMDENDVILSLANYTFDPSIVEIYQPLMIGARCVLVAQDVCSDGMALWRLVQEVRPTILNATPATFKMLIEAGWGPSFEKTKIICGGETMSPALARELLARCTSLWNVYGPTETTALCALHEVTTVETPIPIGRAMPNMQLYVLDDERRPLPDGEIGELYIGGVCVTRGYLKRGELTRENFIADPFSVNPDARLYRSGDLAKRRADGNIELIGRVDHQVKIRGYRIEPAGIESVLERHPSVRQAVVLARETGEEKVLVAYVVTREGKSVSDAELRGLVERLLPRYMTPSFFIHLRSMPLNANAKLDRQALLAMPLPEQRSVAAPRDAMERRVLDIFEDVLQVKIGVNEDFAGLGIDSLAAVRAARRIEKELAVTLPMGLLLRSRNIEQMAAELRGLLERKGR